MELISEGEHPQSKCIRLSFEVKIEIIVQKGGGLLMCCLSRSFRNGSWRAVKSNIQRALDVQKV
jgi:hypothetical protein